MRKQPNSSFCFVCGMENAGGLQVAFYDTEDGDGRPEVVARFTARQRHQGYPRRIHGGIVTGILDETIGRAINTGSEGGGVTWGVAAELTVRFQKPVPLDVELEARGRITRDRRRLFEGSGEIYLPDGDVAVTATGRFLKMPLEKISEADPETLGWRVYGDS